MREKLTKILKSPNILGAGFLSVFTSIFLTRQLYIQLEKGDFDRIAVVCAVTLTIMLAFTGLLYARAECALSNAAHRRSLFAAEHCFAGTILFGLSIVCTAAVIVAVYWFQSGAQFQQVSEWLLSTFFGVFCAVFAFFRFMYGLRVAIHRKPWSLTPHKFFRQP
jgi:hypothetical protein